MFRVSTTLRRITAIFLFLLVSASTLSAYQFSPLEQTFGVSGAETTKTYTIVNDSDDSIAVTISALIRDQDENGKEVNQPATNYFSIQPSKVIVKAQSSQIIRVTYRGPRTVTNELSFRIKAEQIAYNRGRQNTDSGMFNFLYNYITSAYVSPSKETARLVVTGVASVLVPEVSTDDTGKETTRQVPKLAVTLSNQGTIHQLLLGAELTVSDNEGNTVVLNTKDQLGDLLGMNVLAKKRVTINIPMPEGLSTASGATYQGSIKYSE